MAEDRDFDPRLVVEANRSLSFIFRAFDAFKMNPGLSIGAIIGPHIRGNRCDLINPGLVLAACYIYFVYPREALGPIDLSGIDLSPFDLSEPAAAHEVLRRLRNSLSHGRFSINDEGFFMFRDQRSDGTDAFAIRVHFLGKFVDDFGERASRQIGVAGGTVVH